MRKIVILSKTTGGYTYERQILGAFEEVEIVISSAMTEDDIIEVAHDAEVILYAIPPITERILNSLEKCKLIVRYGIGYDNVDLKAAAERGIYVCNAPHYGTIDVAEHALSLLFAVAKRTVKMHERAISGGWGTGGTPPFLRLAGKTIGFVGFGNIGKAVCKRTNALDMKPLIYDPYISDNILKEYGAEKATLDELLANSDFVSLHLPLNKSTNHMFGKEMFAKMKPSAILINTSRGAIVNEQELIEALEAKMIAGVGLDVFEDEKNPLDERLTHFPSAVLTPHVAWNTDAAIPALHKEVSENVARYLRGERPESVVNGL